MRRRVSGSTETEGCPVRVTLTDALRLSFQALDSRPTPPQPREAIHQHLGPGKPSAPDPTLPSP